MKNQPSSAMPCAATIFSSGNAPPTSQSQLPLFYPFSAAEPHHLDVPFAVFLDYVGHWEGHSDATYA